MIVKTDGSFAALVVGVGNGLSPCGPVCPADQSDQIHHIWPASKCAGVQLRSVDITGVSARKKTLSHNLQCSCSVDFCPIFAVEIKCKMVGVGGSVQNFLGTAGSPVVGWRGRVVP